MPVSTYPRGHAQVENQDIWNFPRFPQVKRVNINKHQEQTPKTRVGQKIACAAAKIMASQPPHDFRQQDNQPRFCPNIVEKKITIAKAGR